MEVKTVRRLNRNENFLFKTIAWSGWSKKNKLFIPTNVEKSEVGDLLLEGHMYYYKEKLWEPDSWWVDDRWDLVEASPEIEKEIDKYMTARAIKKEIEEYFGEQE